MKVSNKTKRRFKRKIKNMKLLIKENKITYRDYIQVKNSYLGHLNYGNTKKLVKLNIEEKRENNLNVTEVRIEDKSNH